MTMCLNRKKHVGQVFTKKTYWGCEYVEEKFIISFFWPSSSSSWMSSSYEEKKYAQIQMATDIFSTNGHNHDDDPLSTMKIHLFSLLVFFISSIWIIVWSFVFKLALHWPLHLARQLVQFLKTRKKVRTAHEMLRQERERFICRLTRDNVVTFLLLLYYV